MRLKIYQFNNYYIYMDVSTNIIDLEYLTNPCYTIKVPKQKIDKVYTVDDEDLKFYKKRIFYLTRDLLLGKNINIKIKDTFHNYCKVCIEHFKFIDKKDIIQEDYKGLKLKKKQKGSYFNLEQTDKLVFKKEKKYNDISTFLKIKKPKKEIFMPQQRNFNLKKREVQQNNLSNKYEEGQKKQKKKKKKGEKNKGKKKNCVKVEI